jgi:hypothetical protein
MDRLRKSRPKAITLINKYKNEKQSAKSLDVTQELRVCNCYQK